MRNISRKFQLPTLIAVIAMPIAVAAQQQDTSNPNIIVDGALQPEVAEAAVMTKGPEIKGIISARNDDKIKVTAADGTSTVIAVTNETRIKTGGLFGGGGKFDTAALLNGLPVTVKTMQAGDSLVASQVTLRSRDLKTATMIPHRNGRSNSRNRLRRPRRCAAVWAISTSITSRARPMSISTLERPRFLLRQSPSFVPGHPKPRPWRTR